MDPEIGMLLSAAEQRELTEDELVRLLGCPEDSPEASAIISHAHSLALSAQEGIGEIGAQIGIATGPCHADCAFCAFAFSTTDADDYVMPEDVLRRYVRETTAAGDVSCISLMTINDTEIDVLLDAVRTARAAAPSDVVIAVNTGDRAPEECAELRRAGASRAYHALRLGEGAITWLEPRDRLETVSGFIGAGIEVYAGTEPVYAGVSDREIASNYLGGMQYGFRHGSSSAMVPVGGTRFSRQGVGAVSARRADQISSALLLSTFADREYGPIGYYGGFYGGFGKVFAEFAGSPKGTADYIEKADPSKSLQGARKRLLESGYGRVRAADGSVRSLSALISSARSSD